MTPHEESYLDLPKPWQSSAELLKFAWERLRKPERRRLIAAALVNTVISFVDFAALLAVAGVMGLVVASLDESFQTPSIPLIGENLQLSNSALIVIGLSSAALLSIKTLFGFQLLRRIFLYTAKLQPKVANYVYAIYLKAPYAIAQGLSRASVSTAVTTGSMAITNAIRATIALFGDIGLIFLMMILLLFADIWVFLGSVLYFGLLAYITSKLMGHRLSTYGQMSVASAVKVTETVLMSVGYSPEIRLYGMSDNFKTRLAHDQLRYAQYTGLQQVMFLAPRYLLEVGLLVGFLAVTGLALATRSPAEAVVTISLFALASVRLVPALQRLSMNLGQLRLAKGQSRVLEPVIDLLRYMTPSASDVPVTEDPVERDLSIQLLGVDYVYPGSSHRTLKDIDLCILAGQTVALVGPTGSGKSTLARMLVGLLEPTSGKLVRNDLFRGEDAIGIVPQDIYIAPDTIRNNIALSILGQTPDDVAIWQALEFAQLADVVAALPDQLDCRLGESGTNLSGGESQRLAVARALYRKPKFLVLDEATSSLDASTEAVVTESIRVNSPDCTLVVVAHRLATIINADQIVYIENGRVAAQGTFSELTRAVPDFAISANLQGLNGE